MFHMSFLSFSLSFLPPPTYGELMVNVSKPLLSVEFTALEQKLFISLPEIIYFCLLWCIKLLTVSVKNKLCKLIRYLL